MRRLLILIFALSCSSWASIAYVSASGTNCHVTTAGTGSACTLAAATTANNDVIVGLSFKTTTRSINKIVGSSSGAVFSIYSQIKDSTNTTSAILVCRHCPALTTITPTFSGTTLYELNVAEYSGVTWMGITGSNTGSSTTPGLTFTTGDANDFIVCETANLGSTGIPTSGTGTLRQANRTGTTSSNVAGGLIENTVAGAGSVSCTDTITSGVWSAAGVELRTTAPTTYIWPDCDSTHPCVIHHRDSVAQGINNPAITTPFFFRFQPSLANNLIKFTVSHPSSMTISTIASFNQAGSATGDTWSTGATVTDATDGYVSEIRYVCAASTGTAEIRLTLSTTVGISDLVQMSYDEVSGIATTSCSDGTSGTTNTALGPIQPGSITPSQSGDWLYTYAIDNSQAQENGWPSGWMMPDDTSALIWEYNYDNFVMTARVLPTSSAVNSTIYVDSVDPNNKNLRWNVIAQAFKASSGAGTQPPAGRAWVIRNEMYRNANPAATYLPVGAFPTSGNAFLLQSTQHVTSVDFSTLKDNYQTTLTSNTVVDTTFDPQQYAACLATNTQSRDRAVSWTMAASFNAALELNDIAGAKASSGTGCIGNKAQNKTGIQALVNNSNIVSSAFSSPFSFSPTLNSTAYSAVFVAEPYGAGPPSGACASGGVTPPSCTGNSSNFILTSIWASGMTDGSHYSNGDTWGYWYTNSSSAYSIDMLMQNSADQPGGGSGADIGVTEILGEPAVGGKPSGHAVIF